MKQMDVFKKIGGILKELNDQYDYLAADPSELNELELELFVANAHFLKDHAEILRLERCECVGGIGRANAGVSQKCVMVGVPCLGHG